MPFDPSQPFEIVEDAARISAFDPSQPFELVEDEEATLIDRGKDAAIDTVKGIIASGEGAVGVGDVLTGNAVGEWLSDIGYDPKKTHEILDAQYSPERQAENAEVTNATGFVGKGKALLRNPAVIGGGVIQSAPMMLGGMAAVKAIGAEMLAAEMAKDSTVTAAEFFARPDVIAKLTAISGATEGAQTTGIIQEQARQEGREWGDSVLPAVAAGVGTGAIGVATSKIPGLQDAEVAAATSMLGGGKKGLGLEAAKDIGKSMVKEGPLEEGTQSYQEQGFSNLATGKPWGEGTVEAAAEGSIVGAAQGGGVTAGARVLPGRPVPSGPLSRAAAASPAPAITPVALPQEGPGPDAGGNGSMAAPPESVDSVNQGLADLRAEGVPLAGDTPAAGAQAAAPDMVDDVPLEFGGITQPATMQELIDNNQKSVALGQGQEIPEARPLPEVGKLDLLYKSKKTAQKTINQAIKSRAIRPGEYVVAPGDGGWVIQPKTAAKPAPGLEGETGPGEMDSPGAGPLVEEEANAAIARQEPPASGEGDIQPRADGQNLGLGLEPDSQERGAPVPTNDGEGGQGNVGVSVSSQEINAKAHEAATSPHNDLPQPTDAQKKAGNYAKGHIQLHGLDISIENPKGSTRSGTDKSGKQWNQTIKHHYGYFKGTIGPDKDHVDVFLGGKASDPGRPVFVVDQVDPKTGKYDEPKVVIGAADVKQARQIYLSNYEKGWKGIGAITPMALDQFKAWVKDPAKTVRPAAEIKREESDGSDQQAGGRLAGVGPVEGAGVPGNEPGASDRTGDAAPTGDGVPGIKAQAEARRNALLDKAFSDEEGAPELTEGERKELALLNAGNVGTWHLQHGKNSQVADERPVADVSQNAEKVDMSAGSVEESAKTEQIDIAKPVSESKNPGLEMPAETADTPAASLGDLGDNISPNIRATETEQVPDAETEGRAHSSATDIPSGAEAGAQLSDRPSGETVTGPPAQAAPATPQTSGQAADAGEVIPPGVSSSGESVEIGRETPASRAEAATNRAITIEQLGDKGSKVRFRDGWNKEVMTISHVSALGSVMVEGSNVYRNATEFEKADDSKDDIIEFESTSLQTGKKTSFSLPAKPSPPAAQETGADPLTSELMGMSDSDIAALVQDAIVESGAAETTTDGEAKRHRKKLASTARAGRKAAAPKLSNPAKDVVAGMDSVLKGIAAAFGVDHNKLMSFPPNLDENAYEKARPFFIEGWNNFKSAGKGLAEYVKYLVDTFKALIPDIGPYVTYFLGEMQGKNNYEADLAERRGKADNESKGGGNDEQLRTPAEDVSEGRAAEEVQGDEGVRGPGSVLREEGGGGARPEAQDDGRRDGGLGGGRSSKSRPVQPVDFRITEDDAIGQGGDKKKFNQNVAAIEILRAIQQEDRVATPEEAKALAKYIGWGGLAPAFTRPDGTTAKGWEKEAARLKDVLTPEEYAAARRSTQDAHYTSPKIISGIYDGLKRIGFAGGRVLEPSVGVGNFIGLMPSSMKNRTKFTGVELDPLTAGIAKALYPNHTVANMGFQAFTLTPNSFDAAIGNPPFGSQTLFDPNNKHLKGFSIHNFFFAKSVEALRPGGVLAMVVSNSLMDKHGSAQREWLAERTKLLGAIRLPNNAFRANAGTDVTTDIVFLQKLGPGVENNGPAWIGTRRATADGVTYNVNEYFHAHPEMMLGELVPNKTRAGKVEDGEYAGVSGLENKQGAAWFAQAFKAAIDTLPQGVYEPGQSLPSVQKAKVIVSNPGFIKQYGYGLDDKGQAVKRLMDDNGEQVYEHVTYGGGPLSGVRLERLKGMMEIRDALRRLIRAELSDDQRMDNYRAALNKVYDKFVAAHGYIHDKANGSIIEDDPNDYPLLRSLEDKYEKGLSKEQAKKTGEKTKAPSAKKAAIFTVRVREPYRKATTAANAKDALAIVLREGGAVDMDRITSLTGISEESALKELAGVVFKNPATSGYETKDTYLSGNVKKKLALAQEAAQADPSYRDNVTSLEEVLPADIKAEDIHLGLGSHWIPADVYRNFFKDVTGFSADITFLKGVGQWSINFGQATSNVGEQFSTRRVTAAELAKNLIIGKDTIIYDHDADGTRVANKEETLLANEKSGLLAAEFKRWAIDDLDRSKRLEKIYNDEINVNSNVQSDGSHMIFPGMGILNAAKKRDDQLRQHQKNAVWRLVQKGKGLLDHVVGAGKTYAAIAAGLEMKRMGLLKKPLYVVPNHLVPQWSADFQKLYPGANVLVVSKKDFAKKNRAEFMGRIATGDWDAVVMAHSSFGFVPSPSEYEAKFYQDMVDQYEKAIEAMRLADGKKSRSVKDMEKAKDRLKEKLKALADKPKDSTVDFSELGVDGLFVDEAHEFKNLFYATKRNRVAGLGNKEGSKKAFDMFVKTQFLAKANNGKGVFFMTGTPVSNTIAEMFTMQRYLDYQRLQEMGVNHFDQWANLFADLSSDWELDPTGTRYRMQSRFRAFVNMPELMTMYRDFADVVSQKDLRDMAKARGEVWPVPDVAGDKPRNVVVPKSELQSDFMDWIVYRMDNMPKDPREDNPLAATGDAMKGALDMRLIDPSFPDHPGSKVNKAADNIYDTYRQWHDKKGTQLVFCDLSVPKKQLSKLRAEYAALTGEVTRINSRLADERLSDEARLEFEQQMEPLQKELEKWGPAEVAALSSEFSVYDDIKAKLIAKGIPEHEIAFIHDANTDNQKEDLFGKVRSGQVRVLIGSTAKMGAGMNVQDKLVALHHLDAPWRPSDLEQREGRIIRQGNEFYEKALAAGDPSAFTVEIYRYATKETLDARRWQVIESKAKVVEQLRNGDSQSRTIEDVGGEASNAAEMKAAASGNPLILEEIHTRQGISKIEALQRAFSASRREHELRIRRAVSLSDAQAGDMNDLAADIMVIKENPHNAASPQWSMQVHGKKYAPKIKLAPEGSSDKETKEIEEANGKALVEAKTKAGQALADFVKTILPRHGSEWWEVVTYRGVPIQFSVSKYGGTMDVTPLLRFGVEYGSFGVPYKASYGENDKFSGSGLITRLDNILDGIVRNEGSIKQQMASRLEMAQSRAEASKVELAKPFPHDEELKAKRERHAQILRELHEAGQVKQEVDTSKFDKFKGLGSGGGITVVDEIDAVKLMTHLEGRDDARYSRTQAPATGNTVDEAEQRLAAGQDAKAVARLTGTGKLKVVQSVEELPKGATPLYMTAWHGSPHTFDKFSTDKIGTGEGLQVYGHGLYFAGSKDVAEWYRDQLVNSYPAVTIAGEVFEQINDEDRRGNIAAMKALFDIFKDDKSFIDELKAVAGGAPGANLAIKEAVIELTGGQTKGIDGAISIFKKGAETVKDWTHKALNTGSSWQQVYMAAEKILARVKTEITYADTGGGLYEVELAPEDSDYLLWDKPLSEQSEKVKAALAPARTDEFDLNPIDGTDIENGATAYARISSALGSDKAASKYLHSLGIRGIKYLDGTSRRKGEGNYNYVIFSDEDVEITARYARDNGQIGGAYFFGTDTMYLVADGIKPGAESRTLYHEAFHRGNVRGEFRPVLGELGRMERMYRGGGKMAEWFVAAQEAAQVDRQSEHYLEEIGAYAVQHYDESPNVIKRWVDKLIAKVKVALMKVFGPRAFKLDPAMLREIAAQGLRGNSSRLGNEVGADTGIPTRFSRTEGDTMPTKLQEDTEQVVEQARGKFAYIENDKKDLNLFDLVARTMLHFRDKIPAVRTYHKIIEKRADIRAGIEDDIFGEDLRRIRTGKETDLPTYTKAMDYLVKTDQDRTGYQLGHSVATGRWSIYKIGGGADSPRGGNSPVYEDLTEAEAVKRLVDMEVADYVAATGDEKAAALIRAARDITNRQFDEEVRQLREYERAAREADMAAELEMPAAAKKWKLVNQATGVTVALYESRAEALMEMAGNLPQTNANRKRIRTLISQAAEARQSIQVIERTADEMATDPSTEPISISAIIAMLGELRGTYFPRVRDSGRYVMRATKPGANPILEKFDAFLPDGVDDGLVAKGAKSAGNFLFRFGKYITGQKVLVQRSDELRKQGYNVEVVKDDAMPEDMFDVAKLQATINNLMNAAVEKSGASEKEANRLVMNMMAQEIAKAFMSRGALSSHIARSRATGKGVVLGYETDLARAVAKAGKRFAGAKAKAITSRDAMLAITGRDESWAAFKERNGPDTKWEEYQQQVEGRRLDAAKQPIAYRAVMTHFRENLRNDEAVDRLVGTLKGLAVLKFLGFRVSSAAANATNMMAAVPAVMNGDGKVPLSDTWRYIGGALAAYGRYLKSTYRQERPSSPQQSLERLGSKLAAGELKNDDRLIFDYIHSKGWDEAIFNQEATAELRGKVSSRYDTVMGYAMAMFGAVEKVNRATTIAAAFKGVMANNPEIKAIADPYARFEQAMDLAHEISNKAHGEYGKVDEPYLVARMGPPARMFSTFQKFTHNYLQTLTGYGFNKETRGAAVHMLLAPAILSGVSASAIAPVIFAALKGLGLGGDDPEEDFYRWADETFGGGDWLRSGAVGLGGRGVDLRSSLGVSYGIPTTLADLLGAPAGVVTDEFEALTLAAKGDGLKALEKALPAGLGNPVRAYRESTEGVTTKSGAPVFYGRDPIKNTSMDAAMRFFSFNPARMAKIREIQWAEKAVAADYSEARKDIYGRYRKLYSSSSWSKEDQAEVVRMVTEYNERVKRSGRQDLPVITAKSIRANMKRSFRPSKAERLRAVEE